MRAFVRQTCFGFSQRCQGGRQFVLFFTVLINFNERDPPPPLDIISQNGFVLQPFLFYMYIHSKTNRWKLVARGREKQDFFGWAYYKLLTVVYTHPLPNFQLLLAVSKLAITAPSVPTLLLIPDKLANDEGKPSWNLSRQRSYFPICCGKQEDLVCSPVGVRFYTAILIPVLHTLFPVFPTGLTNRSDYILTFIVIKVQVLFNRRISLRRCSMTNSCRSCVCRSRRCSVYNNCLIWRRRFLLLSCGCGEGHCLADLLHNLFLRQPWISLQHPNVSLHQAVSETTLRVDLVSTVLKPLANFEESSFVQEASWTDKLDWSVSGEVSQNLEFWPLVLPVALAEITRSLPGNTARYIAIAISAYEVKASPVFLQNITQSEALGNADRSILHNEFSDIEFLILF